MHLFWVPIYFHIVYNGFLVYNFAFWMILMHVLKHIEQFNLLYKYVVFGKYFFFFGKSSVCIRGSFIISHALSALFDVCWERNLIELGDVLRHSHDKLDASISYTQHWLVFRIWTQTWTTTFLHFVLIPQHLMPQQVQILLWHIWTSPWGIFWKPNLQNSPKR